MIQMMIKRNKSRTCVAFFILGIIVLLAALGLGGSFAFRLNALNTSEAEVPILSHWLKPVVLTQSSLISLSRVIPPNRAFGQLIFINDGSTDITIQSTILRENGQSITFTGPITVPAIFPAPSIIATGYSIIVGSSGAIPQLTLVQACCGKNIVVKNTTMFALQKPAPLNDVLQQIDIDTVSQPLIAEIQQNEIPMLDDQVRGNEHVVSTSRHCQPTVTANHRVGARTAVVTITVSVTCNEEVNDY